VNHQSKVEKLELLPFKEMKELKH